MKLQRGKALVTEVPVNWIFCTGSTTPLAIHPDDRRFMVLNLAPVSGPDSSKHNPDPQHLRELIKRAGLSQTEAAKRIGLDPRKMRKHLRLPVPDEPASYVVQYALEQLAGGCMMSELREAMAQPEQEPVVDERDAFEQVYGDDEDDFNFTRQEEYNGKPFKGYTSAQTQYAFQLFREGLRYNSTTTPQLRRLSDEEITNEWANIYRSHPEGVVNYSIYAKAIMDAMEKKNAPATE